MDESASWGTLTLTIVPRVQRKITPEGQQSKRGWTNATSPSYQLPTFHRGDVASTLDLTFTNQPTNWTPNHLDSASTDSDHSIISGSVTPPRQNNYYYKTIESAGWDTYCENKPGFQGTTL